MTGHAAIPELEKNQRILDEVSPIVEKHVSEPAAQDDAEEGRSGDEVSHFRRPNIGISLASQMNEEAVCRRKSQHIGEAIPTQADAISEFNEERT